MVMVMLLRAVLLRAMDSHMIEVLIRCWSGVVFGNGLAQGLGRD